MPDAIPAVPDVLTIGPLTFDPTAGRAWSSTGGRWHVSPDQGAILVHLLQQRSQAVPAADPARVMRPHRGPKEKPDQQLRGCVQAVATAMGNLIRQRVVVRGRPLKGDETTGLVLQPRKGQVARST